MFVVSIMRSLLSTRYFQNWTQIVAIFIVSITLLNEGMSLAWSSSAILILTNPDHPLKMTKEETSYFSVLPCIGLILTALPVGFLANTIGRKRTLILGTIPYFISGVLLGFSNSKWTFYAARFIQGFGSACSFGASPLYCGEVALPTVRGKWGNLLMINVYVGIFISYLVGSYFDLLEVSYFYMATPLITFFLLLGIPESPYYLIKKNNHSDAKTSLQWLRQRNDVDEELAEITSAIQRQMETSSSYKDIILIRSNRKALIAGGMTRIAQQFCGATAVVIYSHTIFTMAGGHFSASTSTIICGAVQVVFVIIGTMVNHKLGRRTTLFSSASVCITLLILMAVYFYLDAETILDLSNWSWVPLAGLLGYLSAYAIGLSFVPTLLGAELFSSSVKEKSLGITNIVYAALIAITTKIFQVLVQYGLHVPFAFFAITCSILMAVCYFVVPETKGKTLEEIQLAFNGKK